MTDDVAKSWEVRKEEKECFRFHAVARDGSKYTIVSWSGTEAVSCTKSTSLQSSLIPKCILTHQGNIP